MANPKRQRLIFPFIAALGAAGGIAAWAFLPTFANEGPVVKNAEGTCLLQRVVDEPGGATELSGDEAAAAYACIVTALQGAYAKSGDASAAAYQNWKKYNIAPYVSATHGGRLVNNYANTVGADYGKFEDAGILPVGTILGKDSLSVAKDGAVRSGPLFLMEKMAGGFSPETGDWKYTLITPTGRIQGVTNGQGSEKVQFCAGCHMAAEAYDYLFFMPQGVRAGD